MLRLYDWHQGSNAEVTVVPQLNRRNERKVLYIFSFLTFWFFWVKPKEHKKIAT
jgi:hypothetical protein